MGAGHNYNGRFILSCTSKTERFCDQSSLVALRVKIVIEHMTVTGQGQSEPKPLSKLSSSLFISSKLRSC